MQAFNITMGVTCDQASLISPSRRDRYKGRLIAGYHGSDISFIRCENCDRFYAICVRFHPDFNTYTFGHCVIFSSKKVTPPPPQIENARTAMVVRGQSYS